MLKVNAGMFNNFYKISGIYEFAADTAINCRLPFHFSFWNGRTHNIALLNNPIEEIFHPIIFQ